MANLFGFDGNILNFGKPQANFFPSYPTSPKLTQVPIYNPISDKAVQNVLQPYFDAVNNYEKAKDAYVDAKGAIPAPEMPALLFSDESADQASALARIVNQYNPSVKNIFSVADFEKQGYKVDTYNKKKNILPNSGDLVIYNDIEDYGPYPVLFNKIGNEDLVLSSDEHWDYNDNRRHYSTGDFDSESTEPIQIVRLGAGSQPPQQELKKVNPPSPVLVDNNFLNFPVRTSQPKIQLTPYEQNEAKVNELLNFRRAQVPPSADPAQALVQKGLIELKSVWHDAADEITVRENLLKNDSSLSENDRATLQSEIKQFQMAQQKASNDAQELRNLAEENGVDFRGYGADTSLAQIRRQQQSDQIRQLQDAAEAEQINGRARQELMNLPTTESQLRDYYEEMRSRGLKPYLARMAVDMKHDEIRERNAQILSNGFMQFGVNDDGTINPYGERLLSKLAGEDLVAAELFSKQFASPQNAFNAANELLKQGMVNETQSAISKAQLESAERINQTNETGRNERFDKQIDFDVWDKKRHYQNEKTKRQLEEQELELQKQQIELQKAQLQADAMLRERQLYQQSVEYQLDVLAKIFKSGGLSDEDAQSKAVKTYVGKYLNDLTKTEKPSEVENGLNNLYNLIISQIAEGKDDEANAILEQIEKKKNGDATSNTDIVDFYGKISPEFADTEKRLYRIITDYLDTDKHKGRYINEEDAREECMTQLRMLFTGEDHTTAHDKYLKTKQIR